jgi:hypothetical protein
MRILVRGRGGEKTLSADLNENFANLDDDRVVLRLENVGTNTSFLVPLGYRISSIDVVNTTANAVTGGLNFGTAEAGAQLGNSAVAANAIVTHNPTQRLFTAAQTVHVSAASAWNSAVVNVIVILDQLSDV